MAHNDQRMKRVFPSFFPKDCPPDDAQSSADEFFRLVRADPPEENDFRSHVELGINGRFDRCIGSGLSVFTELNDIYKLKRRVKAFEKRRVARGRAEPKDGLAVHTPTKEEDSHHTWWLFEGATVAKKFVVIEDNEGKT